MNKSEVMADMATKHQAKTGQIRNNTAVCTPTPSDAYFMCSWHHDIPGSVLLYVYNGSCKIEYGSKNTLVELDSTTNQMQVITPEAGAKEFSFELVSYTPSGGPDAFRSVGASW